MAFCECFFLGEGRAGGWGGRGFIDACMQNVVFLLFFRCTSFCSSFRGGNSKSVLWFLFRSSGFPLAVGRICEHRTFLLSWFAPCEDVVVWLSFHSTVRVAAVVATEGRFVFFSGSSFWYFQLFLARSSVPVLLSCFHPSPPFCFFLPSISVVLSVLSLRSSGSHYLPLRCMSSPSLRYEE